MAMIKHTITALFLQGCMVLAHAEGPDKKDFTFESLESYYVAGGCDGKRIYEQQRRQWALLFVQDVLVGVVGGDSLSRDAWGDFDLFRIGRQPDATLTTLHDYASREDVEAQVIADIESMHNSKQLPDKIPEDLHAFTCELYKMLAGKDYAFKSELQTYLQTLNRKIRNRNLQNLKELLEE